jgi:hypothetical protein
LVQEATLKAREGVTYESAAFNEDCFSGSTKREMKTWKKGQKQAAKKRIEPQTIL